MTACRSCDASVVFVPSAKTGKAMILDAKPSKGVVILDDGWHEDDERNHVVFSGMPEANAIAAVTDVYTDHHATCPYAAEWVGKTRGLDTFERQYGKRR